MGVVLVGDEKPLGERVARLEAVVPLLVEGSRRLEEKIDKVLVALDENLKGKASKDDVRALTVKVEEVQRKVWYASGGGAMLSLVIGWFAKGAFK